MLADDKIVPPVQYEVLWLILGIALLVAIAAWLVFLFRSTRKKLTPAEMIAKGKDPYVKYRKKYISQMESIDQQYRSGQLGVRELHLSLSALVRQFAQETRGINAETATLSDLRKASGAGPLTDLIEQYYHPEFAENPTADAERSMANAREVISGW